MKKKTLREQIGYRLDCVMSRGPIAMSIALFIVTAIAVTIIGVLAYFVKQEGGIAYQIWTSLMHTLDVGTLAGNTVDKFHTYY